MTTLSSAIVQSDGVQSEYGNSEAAEPTGLPHLRRGRCGIGASSDLVCLTARELDDRRPAGDANPRGDVDNPRAGDMVVAPREGDEVEEEEAVRPARAVRVTPQHEMKKNFIVIRQLRRVRRNCDPYGVKKRGTLWELSLFYALTMGSLFPHRWFKVFGFSLKMG